MGGLALVDKFKIINGTRADPMQVFSLELITNQSHVALGMFDNLLIYNF